MHVRQTLTAVLVAATAATALPAAASAAPNTGTSSGSDSSYCQTLLERTKRYNDLAHDPRQSQAVRDFYASRAAVTLLHAQQAGCGWATRQAVRAPSATTTATATTRAAGTAPARTTRTTRRRATFRALNRSFRTGATGGTIGRVPSGVAYIKAAPSGNPSQDDYCRKVADLIADADKQGDVASINGNQESADAWYELADYMTDVATQNGCRFVLGIKASTLKEYQAPSAVAARS